MKHLLCAGAAIFRGLLSRSRQALPLGIAAFPALCLYQRAKQLSMFLGPRGAPVPFGIECLDRGPERVALVRSGRFDALIVTDQSSDVLQLARAMASVT